MAISSANWGIMVGGFWGKLKLVVITVFAAVMSIGIWRASQMVEPVVGDAEMAQKAEADVASFTTMTVLRKSSDDRTHIYISRPVLKDDRINTDLQTFVDEQLALFSLTQSQDSEDEQATVHELNIIFDVAFETEDYIAFSFENGHFIGDKGTQRTHTCIYDKASGERLGLRDLFLPNSDYLTAVSNQVVTDLKLQAEIRLDRFFTASKDERSDDEQLQVQYDHIEVQGLLADAHETDFALTSDGTLVFAFPESLVDPEREGVVQARVELETYSDLLAPAIRRAVAKPEAVTFETKPLEPVFVTASLGDRSGDHEVVEPNCALLKCVALTFDDGPGHYTSRLLDTLSENNVTATFFLVGHRIKFHSEDVKRMVVDGHEIGNHSWSHPRLVRLSDAQVRGQIERTNDVLQVQTGIEPELFRPPYGEFNSRVLGQIEMPVILWNHDTWDWRVLNAEIVAQRTANVTQSGSIVLLHDIHRTTVDAMPEAIANLRNQGYTFVTISQLFAPQVPETQQVYSKR